MAMSDETDETVIAAVTAVAKTANIYDIDDLAFHHNEIIAMTMGGDHGMHQPLLMSHYPKRMLDAKIVLRYEHTKHTERRTLTHSLNPCVCLKLHISLYPVWHSVTWHSRDLHILITAPGPHACTGSSTSDHMYSHHYP
jgi:hypothetical protein